MLEKTERLKKRPDDPPLRVQVSDEGEGICRVECAGPIDIRTAPRFGDGLNEALKGAPRQLVVDLRRVPQIDSVGVRYLVDAWKRMLPGAGLVVHAHDPRIRAMLQLAGVKQIATGTGAGAA